MSNDVSPEAMQTRIQQARREAENLKDRIKRKKDDLADGTRKYISTSTSISLQQTSLSFNCDIMLTVCSLQHCEVSTRRPPKEPNDEDEEDAERTSRQDLCYALVYR
jgi:hypothetical protein